MKKNTLIGFIVGAFMFGFGCNQQQGAVEEAQTTNEEMAQGAENEEQLVNQSDFLTEAASNGMFEVEAGRLAQQNGTNPEVKKFGEMMVNHHTSANKELMNIAQQKNITLPDSMGQDYIDHMQDLRGKKGAEFDQAYADKMVTTHEEAVSLFENAAQDLQDADAKAFASKSLPTLREHMDKANKLKETVNNQNNQ